MDQVLRRGSFSEAGTLGPRAVLSELPPEVTRSVRGVRPGPLQSRAVTATDLTDLLRDVRERQLSFFTDLDETQLLGMQGHHVEPPLWEMGHVAWFQEYWILRHLDGSKPLLPKGDSIYDAFNVSYKLRWSHDFPSRDETLRYADDILRRCATRLNGAAPTEEDAYFYRLVALHEGMHSENLLGVRQARGYPPPPGLSNGATPEPERGYDPRDVDIPGGNYQLGAPRESAFVFDNERWAHDVVLEPYRIASTAVTNEEYARFVDAGGYAERSHWDRRGWEWRRRGKHDRPFAWEQRGGTWHARNFDQLCPLEPRHPICHVNWHEAKAYCRFAGRRLPTEAEWEVAASYDPARGVHVVYPWGTEPPSRERANLDASSGVLDVAALPAGDSPLGCRQMIGNVWEWTSSLLEPYPGFEADPYKEYSLPYFGKKPVLRGGCFATRGELITNWYRNFFIRHRRNIFAGFRTCAL
jgi:iron(II)-dependent oxidoreductase